MKWNKEEWEKVNLGDTATFINGYAFKPTQWRREGKEIIRIQNLTRSSKESNYFDGEIPEKYLVKKGDLLISWSATLGVYEWSKGDAWLNQHIFKVQFDKKEIDKLFFKYLIRASLSKMEREVHGATMKHITKKKFDKVPVVVPPLTTQNEIADLLDTADALRQKTQAQLDALDELAQSVFLEMFGDPVTNEKGWEVRKLGEICSFINGDRSKKYPSGSDIQNKGILFLSSREIVNSKLSLNNSNFISEEKFASLTNGKLKPNDVILVLRGNGTGKCCVFRHELIKTGFINAQLVILRLDFTNVLPDFLVYNLKDKGMKTKLLNLSASSAQPQLSVINAKSFSTILPPLPLQNQFAAIIENIEAQKVSLKASLKESEDLFGCLLQDVFG